MKTALIADVHTNIVPPEAVALDIGRRGVNAVVCFGDAPGAGSQPEETLDLPLELNCAFAMGSEIRLAADHFPDSSFVPWYYS